jgi:DNA replication and repair protein RecF
MPSLVRLVLSSLRNIQTAELEPSPGFNLFFGDNGSGKTSLLEGVHLLAVGRSFRSKLQKSLIMDGQIEAAVFGETHEGLSLGVLRPQRGPQMLRIAGRKAEGLAELSHSLPLQLINSDTFQILEGSPTERRRFLDWGVFHVEHHFLQSWRRARLALQNRNNLLKRAAGAAEIEPWTHELVRNAELMDQQRSAYLQKLQAVLEPHFRRLESGLEPGKRLELDYVRGWQQDSGLFEQIQSELAKDRKYGHTTSGPHRADLRFRYGGLDVAEVLSRGQLKLLICALKIAQGQVLELETGKRCIYLIDDLPAELDMANRSRVCGLLAEQKAQVFLTSIDQHPMAKELDAAGLSEGTKSKLFHVKHGKIAAC